VVVGREAIAHHNAGKDPQQLHRWKTVRPEAIGSASQRESPTAPPVTAGLADGGGGQPVQAQAGG
jgi:hypothetical protein